MTIRSILLGVTAASAAVVLAAAPAIGAAQAKPTAGVFAGSVGGPTPAPIQLTVAKGGTRISGLMGSVAVKNTCPHKITAYQLPVASLPVSAGRFSGSENDYIGPAVKVTVAGTFVTAKKVTGHVTVRFATNAAKCNVTRLFTAKHS